MMKIRVLFPLLLSLCALMPASALAQASNNSTTGPQAVAQTANSAPAPVALTHTGANTRTLSTETINARIVEAKRLLQTGAASANGSPDTVTLAVFDRDSSQIHLLPLNKTQFLTRSAEITANSSLGHLARVQIVRANGVNTAVTIFDTTTGRALVPLVVQFPIIKGGALRQMAYYTSAHPALLSSDVVAEGQTYVRTMLDHAAYNLRAQGVEISPEIVDIAEHLCIVEHTDHKRFLTENRSALFQEILSLYALNEPDTFRYSVSVAGAGGMVQMIPSTYAGVRAQHTGINLNSDFVAGMTTHSNALEAMLLYMQDTWNKLAQDADVQYALSTGIATQSELVAAGYNSNPTRLPSYIRRGGSLWRSLIPAETQMYLAIYSSLDSLVPMQARAKGNTNTALTDMPSATVKGREAIASAAFSVASTVRQLLPALSRQLLRTSTVLPFSLP